MKMNPLDVASDKEQELGKVNVSQSEILEIIYTVEDLSLMTFIWETDSAEWSFSWHFWIFYILKRKYNTKLGEWLRNNILLPGLKKRQDSPWERNLLGKDF